jgi:hypothetical protein
MDVVGTKDLGVTGNGGVLFVLVGCESDVFDAIYWSAQIPVAGVPLAPVRAKIMNCAMRCAIYLMYMYFLSMVRFVPHEARSQHNYMLMPRGR